MSFDEQLKRAIDSLTANLHDEISRRAQQIRDELAAAVEADRAEASSHAAKQQEHLDEAVSEAARTRQQLDEALAEAQQRQQRLDDLNAENTRRQERVDELSAENARQQQRVEELTADNVRQQQHAEELTAENVRYQQRFDDLTAENARQQNDLEEAGAEAARLRQELEAAAAKIAAAPPPDAFVAPAIAAGTMHALDAAGSSAADSPTPERLVNAIREMDDARSLSDILDALLTAASVEAGRAAVLLVRAGRYTGWRSLGFQPPVERGEIVELPADASVIPIDIGGETVAVLRTERSDTPAHADTGLPDPNLELLTRHAARCLESVTAFKAARAALVQPNGSEDSTDDASDDEDASARRYAKLLVSEIKLYHEPEVLAGRRERDLTTRLGGEIARARVLYEHRVPTHIREHTDYFHDELVRTLANGDSTLFHLS
jgi:hypothetical protein